VNAQEGFRRIVKVIRVLSLLWGIGAVVIGLVGGFSTTDALFFVIALGIIPCAIGLLVAWCLEGFAQPR
jgi:hypothetical protein